MAELQDALTSAELGRLQWRSRRGLLENDLLLERFYAEHGASLTRQDVRYLTELLDLSDNDLLDIFLGRKAPEGELNHPITLGLVSKINPQLQTQKRHIPVEASS